MTTDKDSNEPIRASSSTRPETRPLEEVMQDLHKQHPQTEQCGFDRNASISENCYVCECGWRSQESSGEEQRNPLVQAVTPKSPHAAGPDRDPSAWVKQTTKGTEPMKSLPGENKPIAKPDAQPTPSKHGEIDKMFETVANMLAATRYAAGVEITRLERTLAAKEAELAELRSDLHEMMLSAGEEGAARIAAEARTAQIERETIEKCCNEIDDALADGNLVVRLKERFRALPPSGEPVAQPEPVALDTRRLDWLDKHCAFVADEEYKIGPFAIGELRQLADAGLAADWVSERINSTDASTQAQDAKGSEDAERYHAALVRIAEHYTDTDLAAKHMSAHARMILSPTGDSADYVWSNAARQANGGKT